jgi:hypothetical protein
VLLGGLEDVVHFDKQFVRFEHASDGRVTAVFADGTSATGDILIGADGVSSRVRQQYLPHARVVDTRVVALVGKLWLTDESRAWLPRQLTGRLNNVLPPRGSGMFVAEFQRKPASFEGFAEERDYLFWALVAPRHSYGVDADLRKMEGVALRGLALRMIEGWHPHLRRLVGEQRHVAGRRYPHDDAVYRASAAIRRCATLSCCARSSSR